MTLTISKRDVIVLCIGLVIGAVLGTGVGALVTGGMLPAEIIAALVSLALIIIGSIGAVVKVLIDRVSADLQHNTSITLQTLGVATTSANHAAERAQLVDRVTYEHARAEAAERVISIIEGNPACISCRQAIKQTIDQWRIMRQNAPDYE